MASVRYEHATKRFGENVIAVNDLDLDVRDREFLVLVGPSGCGKTTALRLLAGLEEITEGSIYIGDRLVNDVPPKDRDIAMVFQSYALYPHMSVYDNMAFGLKLRKTPKSVIEQRVKEAAQLLGIGQLLERKPKALSGGQRQRVALGRAIVREPQVFLMDEPLSNLDAKLRVATRAEIIKLHQRLETTFIYVTHDQVEAMTMGTRICVMRDGLLHQVDTPQALYDHPANMFVAGFIGSPAMNFFPGQIVGSGSELMLQVDSLKLPVPRRHQERVRSYTGQEVVLGIRPEDIHNAKYLPPGITEADVKATIEVREPMGSEVHLNCILGEHIFVARVDPRTEERMGDTIELSFNMDNMHVFDPKNKKALA